jgi:hypothetical protein
MVIKRFLYNYFAPIALLAFILGSGGRYVVEILYPSRSQYILVTVTLEPTAF